MSITDVIAVPGFAYPGVVTYTRTSPGSTDGYGRHISGATTTLPLSPVGVIPGSSVLQASPHGWSAEQTLTLYTTTKLVKLPTPDVVTIDGEDFAVKAIEGPWVGLDSVLYIVHVARLATPGTD